jgi:bifunctional ADP-heptose synthase (sugar kinase/adenylyltransferase)
MIDKEKFKNLNILVIGDSCIDVFVYGEVIRIAPEAPVPIINPKFRNKNSGMSGNVFENLKSLGSNPLIITNEEQITKTRYVDERSNQILIRVDENDHVRRIKQETLHKIVNNSFLGKKIHAIIVSDYDKGFLNEEDIEFICNNNHTVFIDTKKILDKWCLNATYIKINHVEYEHTKFNLSELNLYNKLIITMSNKGCKYVDKIFPVEKVNIKDVSGAGDTFISGLVLEYAYTKDIEKSILFAQECATIVVQKKGVTTI